MQTQIHVESWMVLLGMAPLNPMLSAPNPRISKIKNTMPAASNRGKKFVIMTSEQRENLKQEIRLSLKEKNKPYHLIMAELMDKQEREKSVILPTNSHGTQLSEFTFRDVVNGVKKELWGKFYERERTFLKVIAMHKEGFSRDEIKASLKVKTDYVTRVLVNAGLVVKRKSPTKANERKQAAI